MDDEPSVLKGFGYAVIFLGLVLALNFGAVHFWQSGWQWLPK